MKFMKPGTVFGNVMVYCSVFNLIVSACLLRSIFAHFSHGNIILESLPVHLLILVSPFSLELGFWPLF